MDKLIESLSLLGTSEKREFRMFVQRNYGKEDNRTLELLRLLERGEIQRGRAGMKKMYSGEMMNAYHSVRKRLLRQLHRFLVIKRMESDSTESAAIMGLINVAGFYMERNAFELAASMLQLAHEKADKTSRFDLLDNIYYLQIQYAQELGLDVQEVSSQWRINKKQSQMAEKISIAHAMVRRKLHEARLSGKVLNIEEMTHEIFIDFELEEEAQHNVSFMYGICSMIRSAIISSKNYVHFASFVARQYNRLKTSDAFSRSSPLMVLGFRYMVAHAFYRNRKWKEANAMLVEMQESLGTGKGGYINHFFPKYILLKAAVQSYTGDNMGAAIALENGLAAKGIRLSLADKLNMQINLAVYYFQSELFGKASAALLKLNHSDAWIEKKMGKEWRLKKNMIEVIVQYELGNVEWALTKIKSMEKHFSAFLEQPLYQRAGIFMGFIRKLIQEPTEISKSEFSRTVDEANLALPGDREDIQAITFFCWLKSKMIRRPYYEVLLEAVND